MRKYEKLKRYELFIRETYFKVKQNN